MPGGDADERKPSAGCGNSSSAAEQTSGDQQRLRDRGVSDGLGVGLGAVVPEIEARHCGQPVEPVSESGFVEPRARETRVSGPPDQAPQSRAHLYYFLVPTKRVYGDATNIRTSYCQFPTICLVLPLAHRAVVRRRRRSSRQKARSTHRSSNVGARFADAAAQPSPVGCSDRLIVRQGRLKPLLGRNGRAAQGERQYAARTRPAGRSGCSR